MRSAAWEPNFEHAPLNEAYISGVSEGEEDINLDALLNGDCPSLLVHCTLKVVANYTTMTGSYTPRSIPCTMNVLYPSYSILSSSNSTQASLHLLFPVQLTGSPLASVTISHNLQANLGIGVVISVDGMAFLQDRMSALCRGAEEFIRRGGGLGVVRWLWEHSKSLVGP